MQVQPAVQRPRRPFPHHRRAARCLHSWRSAWSRSRHCCRCPTAGIRCHDRHRGSRAFARRPATSSQRSRWRPNSVRTAVAMDSGANGREGRDSGGSRVRLRVALLPLQDAASQAV